MELFQDDRERDSRESKETGRERTSSKVASGRMKKAAKPRKKRRVVHGRRSRKAGIPGSSTREAERVTAPPPLIPQPEIELPEDEATPDDRPGEPPPPSAMAGEFSPPGGDGDDLFEYVF